MVCSGETSLLSKICSRAVYIESLIHHGFSGALWQKISLLLLLLGALLLAEELQPSPEWYKSSSAQISPSHTHY